ncbi:Ig-like domain-containing protein [Bifidobacterium stellenboschense]|uniref:Putative cell wall-associated serine proteinase, lactocepin n=1 Tax=Bifidobacterium stellenboschense TaxID=762211 RepID=A0A087DWV7_9BIFI|nr:Ig-like domain-containing protein [Bifidobacterium stellenboschense]KFJ00008.1 putative cell wall-associated serine proteinase, lactocepin [Bifidobacterium stellenboschense]
MNPNTEHSTGPKKASSTLWKALLGGVVSIAMIASTNAVVAYANPASTNGDATTSQTPADGTNTGDTGKTDGTGNTGTNGTSGTGDNTQSGTNGTGDGTQNGSDGTNAGGSTGSGDGNTGTGSGDAASVAAPSAATLDGSAYTATFKEKDANNKDQDVTYDLVNGDGWSVKITAAGAAQVQVSGWYSLDGTAACATAQEQGDTTKCAQIPADKGIVANPDANGVFTFTPGDGVYSLASLNVQAFDASGKTSATVNLGELAGKTTGSTLKNVAKLVVDTDASKATTLTADTTPVKNGNTLSKKVNSFTIANANPLFAQRMRILAAQNPKPQLLTVGSTNFGDAAEAQTKDGKYSLTIDAAAAGKDAFAKDASYTVALNGTALGAGAAQSSATFTIDNDKPVKPAKLGIALAANETVLKDDANEWLVTGDHALTITPADDTAGVSAVTILDKDGKKVTDLAADTDGTYHWTLAADATYDLSKYQVTVTDNAGLVSDPVALDTITRADGFNAAKVIVATADAEKSKIAFGVTGDLKKGGTYNSISGITLSNKNDQYFAKRVELMKTQMGNNALVEVVDANGDVKGSYTAANLQKKNNNEFELTFDQELKLGKYSLRLTNEAITYLNNVNPNAINDLTVDDVAPTISKVTLSTDADSTQQLDGKVLYANATQSAPQIVVDTTDDVSGVAKVVVNAQFSKLNADGTLGNAENKAIEATQQTDGSWVATLNEQGAYDFTNATVESTDNAENTAPFEFKTAAAGTLDFGDTTLYVSTSANKDSDFTASVAIDPDAAETNKVTAVKLESTSPWFKQIVANLPKDQNGNVIVANGVSDTGASYTLTAGAATGKDGKFSLALGTTAFDGLAAAQKNGNHTITIATPFTGNVKTFLFDDTAATVTGFEYRNNGAEDSVDDGDLSTGDGDVKRELVFTAKDLLPDGSDGTGKTAGVKQVTATIGSGDAQALVDNGDGTYTLTLDKPGTYVLSDIKIAVEDQTGNVTPSKSVADLVKQLDANGPLKDVTSITIADAEADAKVATTLLVNGKEYDVAADKAIYLKGDKTPTIQIKVSGNKNFTKRWNAANKTNIPVLTSTLAANADAKNYGSVVLDSYVKSGDDYIITLKPAANAKDLMSATDNGLYTVSLNTTKLNTNKAMRQLLGKRVNGRYSVADKSFSLGVDNVEPSITALKYTAGKNDLTGTVNGEEHVLANSSREISFSAHDLFAALKQGDKGGQTKDDANVAGLLNVTAKVTVEGFDGKSKTEDLKLQGGNGTYTAKLGDNGDGIYKLSDVKITVSDNAKKFTNDNDITTSANANSQTLTLAQIKKQLGVTDIPDQLAVSQSNGTAETLVNGKSVKENGQYYTKDIESVTIKVKDDPAFAFRTAILKAKYGKTNVFDGSSVQYSTKNENGLSATIGDADIDTTAATLTWKGAKLNKLFVPLAKQIAAGKTQTNGNYTIKAPLTDGAVVLLASPKDVKFTLDEVAPEISKISGAEGVEGTSLVKGYTVKGKSYDVYAAAGNQQIKLYVKDLLPEGQSAKNVRDDDNVKNEVGTSGIDDRSVTFSVPAPVDLEGKEIGKAVTDKKADDYDPAKGVFTITLDQEGFYDLNDITVNVKDVAGNERKTASILSAPVKDKINYTAIVADVNDDNSAKLIVDDVKGNPESREPGYYYRGKTRATYEITDKWFPLYQKLTKLHTNVLAGSTGDTAPQDPNTGVTDVKELKVTDGTWKQNGYTWTLADQPVELKGNNDEVEGKYHLNLTYNGLRPEQKNANKDFVMDWTAPKLGNLTSSVTSPAKWNWIFATTGVTVTLDGVNDPISGICSATATNSPDTHDCASKGEESVAFSQLGFDKWISDVSEHPAPAAVYAGTTAAGSISFSFDGDSQRLTLGNTSIALTDAAGNPVDTGALNKYEGVNGDKAANNVKGVEGIAIDTVAPTISIAYDNNDVRNGKYYKAHRTGTVTLVESNFDFSLKNEPARVIVTTTVDGEKRTYGVASFSNPSGDRKTYVATFKADKDGDWTVDASYTDPGDHASNVIHEEFTVDTVAPKLTLTFDNNNVKNGMYYSADRNATVREVERNFSESESVITTTAKDDNKADQPAPGASGWVRTGGERESTEWTNHVAFTGELHYTIKATATDLAGNVAQEVSEPEFVIDKTKPSIKIDRVEDKTAYAGTVAPLITTDDTNIDMSKVKWTLKGAHRGELKDKKLPQSTTKDTDNSQVVDFADFERKVDIDDVYTLTAEATDMAGNTYKTQKTFSANRFGSTYVFTAGTQNLRGAFIKKSQPVTVSEINVSGLDQGKSHVVVAKDASAKQLADKDFTMKTTDDKGWSRTEYTIPAKQFNEDGYYRVQLTSEDKAGNLSQNTMEKKDEDRKSNAEVNFALDTTAPTSAALGVTSGNVYLDQNGRNVGIDAKDNLQVASAEIAVDGETQATWNGNTLLKSTPTFRLPADGARHEITVTTVDKAGNQSTAVYDNITIASNWWQYAMSTAWIRNTIIFGVIIVIAAIAGAIVAISRRRKSLAYRNNPFDRE